MTTPNTSLSLPTPGTTIGPQWAEDLNVALELVDLHDHTSGKGVPVPTAGLNINADLSFASNAALALKHAGFTSDSVDPAIAGAVYVKNGDLYFTSANNTAVQLTDGTAIKGTAGNISGLGDGDSSAVFNDFTEDFTFRFDSGDYFAAFNIGEIRLYPFDGSNEYTAPITIKSPLALASAYQLTLPLSLPLADNILSVTTAGVIQQGLGNGTASLPSLAFASDPDSGVYRIGANNIGVAVNATKILDVATTGLSVTGALAATGAITGASLNIGSGTITSGAITGGALTGNSLSIVGGGAISGGSITGSSLNVGSGALTAGTASVTSINTSSGGAVRMKVYTGTVSAGGSVTLSPPGTLIGAYGVGATSGTGTQWSPILAGVAISVDVRFNAGAGTDTIQVDNVGAGDRLYRVVVLYQ